MLVRRETGPVAGGDIGLADGQLFGVGGAVHDEAGVALPRLYAQPHHAHVRLMNGLRLAVHVNGGGADGDLDVPRAVDLHGAVAGRIEALGLGILKHIAAGTHHAVILAVGGEVGLAAQNDEGHFPVFGFIGVALAVGKLQNAEFQILQAALADFAQGGVAVFWGISLFVIHDCCFLSFTYCIHSPMVSSQSATMP